MGVLVQLVIAALVAGPVWFVWIFLLSFLSRSGDVLIYAAAASCVTSLWIAHRMYWGNERKHASLASLAYPPNAELDPNRVHTTRDLKSSVHK